MGTLKLNTGASMPAIGFGTWKIGTEGAATAVTEAINIGYRLIDTAKIYGNEESVGQAIRASQVPRDQLFITTKLWNDDQGYDSAFRALCESLGKLGLDYLDLYLIHWPATSRRHHAWQALEQIHKSGKARAVGVSNYTVEHLQELLERSQLVPAVNQVEFHPFIYEQQKALLTFCKEQGIVIEAYSPLSRLSRENRPQIQKIAERHAKSPQQVVLRWCIQHGTVPLPRSENPEHIKANFDVFNFELNGEDMELLDNLSDGERVTWDPAGMG